MSRRGSRTFQLSLLHPECDSPRAEMRREGGRGRRDVHGDLLSVGTPETQEYSPSLEWRGVNIREKHKHTIMNTITHTHTHARTHKRSRHNLASTPAHAQNSVAKQSHKHTDTNTHTHTQSCFKNRITDKHNHTHTHKRTLTHTHKYKETSTWSDHTA